MRRDETPESIFRDKIVALNVAIYDAAKAARKANSPHAIALRDMALSSDEMVNDTAPPVRPAYATSA